MGLAKRPLDAAQLGTTMHCRRCGAATQPGNGPHPWCPRCKRPDWLNPAPAVGVAIVRGDQVLLAQRGAPPKAGQWDLIGGFVEPGETVTQAARREALEETGLHLGPLRRLHQAPGLYLADQPTLNFMYVAQADGELQARDDVAQLRWFPLDDLPELAWDHETEALARLARRFATAK